MLAVSDTASEKLRDVLASEQARDKFLALVFMGAG